MTDICEIVDDLRESAGYMQGMFDGALAREIARMEKAAAEIESLRAELANLQTVVKALWPMGGEFPIGCAVHKPSGPEWTGKVVGYYSSSFTPSGLVIENTSDGARGQVHVEPAKRIERTGK